jgi:hypothetical protein
MRTQVLIMLLGEDPEDDRSLTTRMRIARVLARSRELFRPLSDGTLLSFGLDPGTFQRVSDLIMETGGAKRVANVQRTGSISFRSNDETALSGARTFRGGGHRTPPAGSFQAALCSRLQTPVRRSSRCSTHPLPIRQPAPSLH